MGVTRVFIELAYDGRAFHGWQRQPGARTVQQELERALGVCTRAGAPVPVVGCGRTDAGVHASYFVAHADLEALPDEPAVLRLNGVLPADVAVMRLAPVRERAHARYSATERTYHYHLHVHKDPFLTGRSARIYRIPDLAKMQEAADVLVRSGDFGAFCKAGGNSATTLCTVRRAQWREDGGGQFIFEITADRFLRNMVRAIVGTLLEVGYGRRGVDEMVGLLDAADRSLAGKSAAAEGLFLADVRYPADVFTRA